MKRAWFALVLLLALLAAGIGITVAMDRIHAPAAALLTEAADAALERNWVRASTGLHLARQRWEDYRDFSAAVADHEPMEEITAWFARLEIYLKQRNTAEFAAGCIYLSELVEAMGEAHGFSWWNLL